MSYTATFSTWENHQSWRSRCIQQVPYSCSFSTGTISYIYTRLENITAQLKLLLVYINHMAHVFKALSGILGRVLGREQVCVKEGICYIVELLFIHSVVSDSATHGLQHTRLPCPLPSPRACSNSCPLSQWCHPTISSSVVPFSPCLQSFLASGSVLISQLFTSRSQSIGASTSASVLPMKIQDWFPLGLTGLISLLSKGLSRVYNTTVQKHQFFGAWPSLQPHSHIRMWLLEKS